MKIKMPNDWTRWRVETLYTKEPETISWIKNMVPGKVLWDIGANIGVYSLYAASRGVRVVALEPDVENFKALTENIALNDYQIRAINRALWDKSGIQRFSHGPEAGMSTGRVGKGEGYIPVITGEDLVREVEPPDYIKIDIDGGELQVLLGLGNVLHRVQEVLLEITENYFNIFRLLKAYKFREVVHYQGLKTRETAYNHVFRRML